MRYRARLRGLATQDLRCNLSPGDWFHRLQEALGKKGNVVVAIQGVSDFRKDISNAKICAFQKQLILFIRKNLDQYVIIIPE